MLQAKLEKLVRARIVFPQPSESGLGSRKALFANHEIVLDNRELKLGTAVEGLDVAGSAAVELLLRPNF